MSLFFPCSQLITISMTVTMMMSSRSSREEDGQVQEPGGRRPSRTGMFQLGLADTEHDVAAS